MTMTAATPALTALTTNTTTMNYFKIRVLPVSVSLPTALAYRKTEYGESDFSPTPDQLEELSEAAIDWLIRAFGSGHSWIKRLELDEPTVTWEVVKAAIEREVDAEQENRRESERQEALRKAFLPELIQYAKGVTELSRAAADGYNVASAALEYAVNSIRHVPGIRGIAGEVFVEGKKGYEDIRWEERSSPGKDAFNLHDRVRTVLNRLTTSFPPSMSVRIEKISKFYRSDRAEDKYTAVVVVVDPPGHGRRVVVFKAE